MSLYVYEEILLLNTSNYKLMPLRKKKLKSITLENYELFLSSPSIYSANFWYWKFYISKVHKIFNSKLLGQENLSYYKALYNTQFNNKNLIIVISNADYLNLSISSTGIYWNYYILGIGAI